MFDCGSIGSDALVCIVLSHHHDTFCTFCTLLKGRVRAGGKLTTSMGFGSEEAVS